MMHFFSGAVSPAFFTLQRLAELAPCIDFLGVASGTLMSLAILDDEEKENCTFQWLELWKACFCHK